MKTPGKEYIVTIQEALRDSKDEVIAGMLQITILAEETKYGSIVIDNATMEQIKQELDKVERNVK